MKRTIIVSCAVMMTTSVFAGVEELRSTLIEASEACLREPEQAYNYRATIYEVLNQAQLGGFTSMLNEELASIALDCMNQGQSNPRTWVPLLGKYLTQIELKRQAESIEKARLEALASAERAEALAKEAAEAVAAAERARARREAKLKAERADREAKERNFEELARRVYSSCLKLEERNPVAAYTNELCFNSFNVNGVPNFE